MGLILKEIISRTYRSNYCSCSFLFCAILTLIVIIVPFFLAFSTAGFWPAALEYYEQPIVLYRKELILSYLTSTQVLSSNKLSSALNSNYFSTIGELNQLNSGLMSPVDYQWNFMDVNADQKPDFYTFNLTIFNSPKSLRNFRLILQFDYRLRERVNLDMVSLAYVDIDLPSGASEVFIDGSLDFKQRNPLKSSRIVRGVYNETLIDLGRPVDRIWKQVFRRYLDRNESTEYKYSYWSGLGSDSGSIKISVLVRVPVFQEVVYQPIFLQNLKFAWIQYLSLLIPIWLIVSWFAYYVYSEQIFDTAVELKKR